MDHSISTRGRYASVLTALALIAGGCSSSEYGGDSYVPGDSYAPEGDRSYTGSGTNDAGAPVDSGALTAGIWDDNDNYAFFESFRDELMANSPAGLPALDAADQLARSAALEVRSARTLLDIALVIDATGSMGDEMQYLQTEFDAIASEIDVAHPNAETRFALIVYRDQGDEYVTRVFDFSDDTALFQARLGEQSAHGGGDYPEAAAEALHETTQLGWRSSLDVARVAFWVADAPHHADAAPQLTSAIESLAASDVHVYPVASSGVDTFTEYSMRSAAQYTGGRYIFLTDDSGLGYSHADPNAPCYHVTRLDDILTRVVDIELSGEHVEPVPDQIIRSVGNPVDGVCDLGAEGMANVF